MSSDSAFTVHAPSGHFVPLVLDSPHSGTEYPGDFRPAVGIGALRQCEDAFVDELYASGPSVGATLIAARFPRSYIDPNRSILDIDTSLLDGAWPGPAVRSRKTELGIGLIWRILDSGETIYGRKLSVDEVKKRIVNYHQPYQKAVKDALDHAHAHFGAVWHLNCHSMPAVSGRISEEGPGKRRADFVLGDRDGTTCDREFTDLVAGLLGGMGYEVKINDPYKGVELVRAFSDPKAHRHSLQIETNRRLYMDEKTRERSGSFASLKANLDRMIAEIAKYAAARSHDCRDHDHDHSHHGHDHHDHDHHEHGHDHAHPHRQ